MTDLLNRFNQQRLLIRIIVVTIYLGLLNSYALFVVYPVIKTIDLSMILVTVALYIVFSLPLLHYIATRYKPRPQTALIAVGVGLIVTVAILRYIMVGTAVPLLALHVGFYLYAGMIEETLWRGKLWQLVEEKFKNPLMVWGLVTIHFLTLHIPFALIAKPSPLGFLIQVLALGILLGGLRLLTKKVTVPALVHAIINMIVYT